MHPVRGVFKSWLVASALPRRSLTLVQALRVHTLPSLSPRACATNAAESKNIQRAFARTGHTDSKYTATVESTVNDAKDKTISEQILNAENSVREQERSVVSVADGMLPDPSWKSESVGAVKKTRRPIKALLSGTSDLVFEDKTLDDVLASKRNEGVGASVVSVGEGDTVFSAINLMDKQGIGAVLVRNARGDFVGIFTERDYVHKIALQGLPSHSTPVKRAMLTKLTFLSTKDTVTKCMQTMNDGKLRVRHVLVRDANTNLVVGMISVGDILRTIIRAYKETASHMRDFVGGKYTH